MLLEASAYFSCRVQNRDGLGCVLGVFGEEAFREGKPAPLMHGNEAADPGDLHEVVRAAQAVLVLPGIQRQQRQVKAPTG